MNHDKFNDSLSALLDAGRVSYAINTLKGKCAVAVGSHSSLMRVIAELERISDTYGALRAYMLEGNPDPGRDASLLSLKEQIKDLARQYLFIVNEDRLDPFFAEYRLQKVRGGSVAALAEELKKTDYRIEMARETEADTLPFETKREEIIEELFRKIWTLPPWDKEAHGAIRGLLRNGGYDVQCQVISALLLGSLKLNDPSKLMLLVEAYNEARDERLAARELMAIVLVIGRWGDSAVSTPYLAGAFRELEDSLLTYSRLREVVMTLIRTRDTDRVSREVSDAFNSTMKEITPEMLEKLQKEGLTFDSSETGMNPEWEKLMQNKELEDKMKAINDMQLEGMDVMMQTFSRLKAFPFFRTISNWFLPFSASHSSVAPLFATFPSEGFDVMAQATEMCASDRYSFALGIMQMPEDRRNILGMHFGAQLEQLRDLMSDRENTGRKPEFSTEALVYARDLYRFAKLFPKRKDFYDPFEEPVDFLQLPLLRSLLAGDDIIIRSADFYFRHGYYPLALSLYEVAERSGDADRQLYEKIGYCRQMSGNFEGALAAYETADLFSTEQDRSSTWLLKKLAFCNKALGRYERAAEFYTKLLERNPDNLKLEFHLGSVLLRGVDIKKGKEIIAKVRYLDPEHKMAARIHSRLRGHEAFLEGRYKDALALYNGARGDQDAASYNADLAAELLALEPGADIATLRILLDE